MPSNPVKGQNPQKGDPFDRLYRRWAEHAIGRRQDPPSRDIWDSIVLRLLLSEDPVRVRMYRRIEALGDDTLGSDAYELWSKLPDYTANRTAPAKTRTDLAAYSNEHMGSMQRLMEKQGLAERYAAIIETQAQIQAQIKRGQSGVLVIGCIGISIMILMVLIVFFIIALRIGDL